MNQREIKNIKNPNSRNISKSKIESYSERNIEKKRSNSEDSKGETSKYIDKIQKGQYNILVAIRCRPLNEKEKETSNKKTIKILNNKLIILKDPNIINNINNNRSKEISMTFDYIFDENETQENIFNSTTKFLIEGVVNGFNATIFTYGATGAGKTYTMFGNEKNPGIIYLTLKELFNKIHSYFNREYTVKLWYLEIYNENIRDLLYNNNNNNNPYWNGNNNNFYCDNNYLDLREDQNKGIIINGITEIKAKSSEDILNILKKGNKNRTTESTNANETSSRSHAILQINVSYKEKNSGIEYEIKYGKLSLIDLAGSERASVTLNRGNRLIEGGNINKSLLSLGNCINALYEANEKGNKNNKYHIPYRDSKLTRILKDSLGGNSRTVIIANISPSILSFDDTYNTLNFANRAKKIKSNIKRNVINSKCHISGYTNIIKNLQNKISVLENHIGKERDMTLNPSFRKCGEENKKFIQKIKLLSDNLIEVQKKIIGSNYEVFKLKNINNYNDYDINDKIDKINELVEKYYISFKNIHKSIDYYYNKLNKINELERDYASIIINNNIDKVKNINLSYKITIMKEKIEKLNEYIKELENQVIIRDNIVKNENIRIENLENELNKNYKSLIFLREKYNIKKPEKEIIHKVNGSMSNDFLKNNFSENFRFPLFPNNSVKTLNKSEVYKLLSNIRDVNNSINNINLKLKNFENNKSLLRPKSTVNIIHNKTFNNDSLNKNNTKFFPIPNQFKVIYHNNNNNNNNNNINNNNNNINNNNDNNNNNNNNNNDIKSDITENVNNDNSKRIKKNNNLNINYRIKNRNIYTLQNSDNSNHSYYRYNENLRNNQISRIKIQNENTKRFHSNNNNISHNSNGENILKDKSYAKLNNISIIRNNSSNKKSTITKIQMIQKKKSPFKN